MNARMLSLADLRITLNGTFARSRGDLDEIDIAKIIEAARLNEDVELPVLMDVRREQVGNSLISAFVYYSKRDAYFLPEADLYDTIASYVVVVEISRREFVIFKKSCATLTPLLEKSYDVASYDDLLNTFDDSRALIQKLNTREMSVSDKGIRARSYEAADLKGHMSPHAAGRSIPKFTQVRSKNEVRSLSLNTGRINQLSDRVSIGAAADWARDTFKLMAKARVNKTFFATFARRISLEEVLKDARPASILFERASIEEHLSEENIDLWYVRLGKYHKFDGNRLKRFLGTLDAAFEVDEQARLVGSRGAVLNVNKRSISPNTAALRRLRIKNGNDFVTLQSWITHNGYFVVSFNKPEYIYFNKSCFQDRAGRSEVESILKCLHPVESFVDVVSEKGAFSPDSIEFEQASLFSKVEQYHHEDDYIFCDDLGIEWADHIAINMRDACVSFVHSKHKKKTGNSASSLHEVVGQAIKNLGNMHFSFATFSSKMNGKFKGTYSGTRIQRTRKGDPAKANADIKLLLADHRLHRKCVVACSSLSKAGVEKEFGKMKRGASVKGNITQLFWILSSFIHASQGSSSVPIVYCRP